MHSTALYSPIHGGAQLRPWLTGSWSSLSRLCPRTCFNHVVGRHHGCYGFLPITQSPTLSSPFSRPCCGGRRPRSAFYRRPKALPTIHCPVGPLCHSCLVRGRCRQRSTESRQVAVLCPADGGYPFTQRFPAFLYLREFTRGGLAPAMLATLTRRQDAASVCADESARFCLVNDPGFSIAAQMRVARHIALRSCADDTLFVWGFEPTICFLSERRPASRFIYNFPFTVIGSGQGCGRNSSTI